MWYETALQGLEISIVFAAASLAMDICLEYGWISITKQ
jgi:hypothetical protein